MGNAELEFSIALLSDGISHAEKRVAQAALEHAELDLRWWQGRRSTLRECLAMLEALRTERRPLCQTG